MNCKLLVNKVLGHSRVTEPVRSLQNRRDAPGNPMRFGRCHPPRGRRLKPWTRAAEVGLYEDELAGFISSGRDYDRLGADTAKVCLCAPKFAHWKQWCSIFCRRGS